MLLFFRERVALNYLQRMSGIATYTKQVSKASGRKQGNTSGHQKDNSELSCFEKYAVRIGGGCNHRYNLSDGVLLKDNHIGAAGSVAKGSGHGKRICTICP